MIILITAGGSGHAPSRTRPAPARLPALPQTYANRAIGVVGRLPSGWSAIRGPQFLRLASKDNAATIAMVARPLTEGAKTPLLKPAVDAIRNSYPSVVVKHGLGKSLAGLPARSVVIYTRNKHHVPIRILVAAAQGRHTGWVLEAFTAQNASEQDLVETQQIVLALHLTG